MKRRERERDTFKDILVGGIANYNNFLYFNHVGESVKAAKKQCIIVPRNKMCITKMSIERNANASTKT